MILSRQTLLLTATFMTAFATQALAQEGTSQLKIQGFVDAQYKWQKSQDTTTGAVINDGAVYFAHKTGDSEIFIDIPFAWSGTVSDANGDGAPEGDAAIVFGRNKAQAYVAHTFNTTKVQLGQFDTIYGLELNDAPDITLTTQGALFNNMLPFTHTGALVTQSLGPVSVKLLAANTVTGKGDTGAQLKGKGEYGAALGFANETFRGGVGYLTGRITGTDHRNRTFTDLLLGATFGPVAVDVEYALEKYGDADQGTGFVVLPVYSVTPEFSVAARFEQLDDYAGADQKITQITGGVQCKVNDALKVKTDYTSVKTTVGTAPEVDDNLFALAAVYKF